MNNIPDSQLEISPNEAQNHPALLLYFYNDSCAPCVALKPKIYNLVKSRFPKVVQHYYNAVNHPELTASFGVYSSPVFIFFFEGKEVFRGNNYISLDELNARIGRLYDLFFN